MQAKKIFSTIFAVILLLSVTAHCPASGIYYMPDVTGEMSSPSYWTEETDVLMSYDRIENLNKEIISTKGTNMYDLKNQPEIIDGVALNEAIKKIKSGGCTVLSWVDIFRKHRKSHTE